MDDWQAMERAARRGTAFAERAGDEGLRLHALRMLALARIRQGDFESGQALARQGMYGDFFTFYLCDAVLKLNGKGGQPVFVKVASQVTGRCAPK